MGLPKLRGWQSDAVEKLHAGYRCGHKNQLVYAPTGAGKTILAMHLIQRAINKGKKAVFMADRRSIIHQTTAVAESMGLSPSVFMADDPRFDIYNPLQIASMQTVSRRFWPQADLYIIDEAHTLMTSWTSKVNEIGGAVLGLSATPFSGVGRYFTNLVNVRTMKELTDEGILVPLEIYACTKIDTSGVSVVAGEWDSDELSDRGTDILGDVVKEWREYGGGRKTIAFCANVRHCAAVCRVLNESGILASMYTHHTREEDRKALLEDFSADDGKIKILVTVEALAKGFDNPKVGCIMDMRPLRKSFSTLIQMIGRGLRSSYDKENCILLDFSGNILRFCKEFEQLYYRGVDELSKTKKMDTVSREGKEKEVKSCPQCGFSPYIGVCVRCGFEVVIKEDIEHGAGTMRRFLIKNPDVSELDLWLQCGALTKTKGNPETAYGRACHLYKSLTGGFPPNNVTKTLLFEGIKPEQITIDKAVANMYKHNQIKNSFRNK